MAALETNIGCIWCLCPAGGAAVLGNGLWRLAVIFLFLWDSTLFLLDQLEEVRESLNGSVSSHHYEYLQYKQVTHPFHYTRICGGHNCSILKLFKGHFNFPSLLQGNLSEPYQLNSSDFSSVWEHRPKSLTQVLQGLS